MSDEWDSFSHCATGIPFSHTTGILPQGLPSVAFGHSLLTLLIPSPLRNVSP
jgi:hypothetical protein